MSEFTAYGVKSNKIRQMVNNNNVKVCTKFYSDQSKLVSSFKSNFFNSYNKVDLSKTMIIPIFIELYNIDANVSAGNHAVLVVQDNGIRYLYDPNGVVNDRSKYVYYNKKKNEIYDSKTLTEIYKIGTPKTRGVQQMSPGDLKTKYISEGGYCMFYVRQALNYLVQEKESKNSTDLIELATKLTKKNFYTSKQSPFSINKGIEKDSVKLANLYL